MTYPDGHSLSALDAALAAGRRAGLRPEGADFVQSGRNQIVALRPLNVVAKVSSLHGLYPRVAERFAAEVDVVDFLTSRDPNGLQLASPAGPFVESPYVVTFWKQFEEIGVVDATTAVAVLRDRHEKLRGYKPRGILATTSCHFEEGAAMFCRHAPKLPKSELNLIERSLDMVRSWPDNLNYPLQVIHGDATAGNFIVTANGISLIDWEDVHYGPLAWDIACLVAPFAVTNNWQAVATCLAAYGLDDSPSFRSVLAQRILYHTMWSAVTDISRASLNQTKRLAWLSKHFGLGCRA